MITTRRIPNPEDFWKFTDEEMETAKNTDLPDLLEHLGYSVRQVGSRYHTTREMDSLMIKDRRTWKRYSNGKGGDAITFLQEFCGKDFREAVNYLLEFNGKRARDSPAPHSKPAQQEEKPTFALPIPHPDQRRVFAYLQKRGIAPQVIRGFIDSGLLYEDSLHHNCVFVGRDGGGKPVFASKRGTYDLNGSGFKGDAVGSDKTVAFRLPCDPALEKQDILNQMGALEQDEEQRSLRESRKREMEEWLDRQPLCLTEYDDDLTRRFVERITVVDAETIRVRIRDTDVEIEQKIC